MLKPVGCNETPQAAIWVDTETDQIPDGPGRVRHVLRFGWACFRRRIRGGKWSAPQWHRFTTPEGFWSWAETVMRKKTRTYLFAHNLAFDAPVLHTFSELPRRGWELTRAVIDSPPVILGWRWNERTVMMLDTLNIWRMPLDAIGEQIGIPKLDMPADDAPAEVWDEYCRRDVEVIMTACLSWWDYLKSNDLGGFAPTLASQAFRTYRHRFMQAPILIDDDEQALELARSAYHGGRTEAFTLGHIDGPLFLVDINSMYPHVMREHPMPTRLIAYTETATVGDVAAWLENRAVVARVLLQTDEAAYPVVHRGKLVFPIGRFEACLSSPELAHAIQRGHVLHVFEAAVYSRADIFSGFVDYFYQQRLALAEAGDRVGAWNSKIILNSLYGKFGQRGRVYETLGQTDDLRPEVWEEYDAETGELRRYRKLAGLVQEEKREGESRDSHPAIAAHVTAAARMLLWRLIMTAGRAHVHYCDTDSLLVDRVGFERLADVLHPSRLGMLKLEREIPDADIFGAKDYRFGTYSKTKGVKRSARWIKDDMVEQEQWSGLRGLLATGDMDAPVTTTMTKRLRREYDKGRRTPSGRVLPYLVNG